MDKAKRRTRFANHLMGRRRVLAIGQEVHRLYESGESYVSIGKHLGLSPQTVRLYRQEYRYQCK